MTRRRWIADEVRGKRAFLTGAHAHHLARVLRVRPGQQFDISSGTKVFRGTVVAVDEQTVEFDLKDELPSSGSDLKITLALSVIKFDRMEWAIEKSTELGVFRIFPLISQRTDAHLAAASSKRVERWTRIARQASEQSRRAIPPEIGAPIRLKDVLVLPGSLRLVLAESENQLLLSEFLQGQRQTTDLVMAIGSEGGWTTDELQFFQQANWTAVSLGHNILRAETAAIAATAVAISCLAVLS